MSAANYGEIKTSIWETRRTYVKCKRFRCFKRKATIARAIYAVEKSRKRESLEIQSHSMIDARVVQLVATSSFSWTLNFHRNTFPTDPWTFRFDALLLRHSLSPAVFNYRRNSFTANPCGCWWKKNIHRMTSNVCIFTTYRVDMLQIIAKIFIDVRLIYDHAIDEKYICTRNRRYIGGKRRDDGNNKATSTVCLFLSLRYGSTDTL